MVEVNFGVGYGPVSLNYEDVETVEGFTLDWLVAKFAALPEYNTALGRQFLSSGSQEHEVPAGELFAQTHSWDSHSCALEGIAPHQMWQQKLDESIKSGLAGDIADHGVKNPLTYDIEEDGTLNLMDGHHRLAAQVAADPDRKVPLRITDDSFDTYADYITEWFPFFAYCRNAGHIVDDYEATRVWAKFDGNYIRYHTVPNWASPITFIEVSPDAPVGELQKALDTIIEFADGSADDAREESLAWRDFVYDEIADLVEREVDYDEERWTEWYTDWLFENGEYVIDGGGLSFDLDNARAALEAESERRFEERNQPS